MILVFPTAKSLGLSAVLFAAPHMHTQEAMKKAVQQIPLLSLFQHPSLFPYMEYIYKHGGKKVVKSVAIDSGMAVPVASEGPHLPMHDSIESITSIKGRAL